MQVAETGNTTEKQVFVTSLRGVVLKHDATCGPVGTRSIAQRLMAADKQEDIIGHILVTESGGGLSSAVPELSDAIATLQKPIVAWIDGISASAAYYINSYCNHIMASRETDQVGCIGTLVTLEGYPRYSKLPDGKVIARIYADGADEKNEEYEQALEGNFKAIKERVLNPHNEKFKNDVKANRAGALPEHLKGRTFNASQVVGTLIDSIGSLEDAVQKVIELAGTSKKTETPPNKHNTTTMPNLTNLNQIESIKDFAMVDGQASFNEQQLSDIEQRLSEGAEASRNLAEQQNTVSTLTKEKETLTQELGEKNSRINELEAALQEATKDGAADTSAVATKDTDASGSVTVVDEFQQAKEFCENHLKNHR
jgi:protease-4